MYAQGHSEAIGGSSTPAFSATGGANNVFQVGQQREAPPAGLLPQVCHPPVDLAFGRIFL